MLRMCWAKGRFQINGSHTEAWTPQLEELRSLESSFAQLPLPPPYRATPAGCCQTLSTNIVKTHLQRISSSHHTGARQILIQPSGAFSDRPDPSIIPRITVQGKNHITINVTIDHRQAMGWR